MYYIAKAAKRQTRWTRAQGCAAIFSKREHWDNGKENGNYQDYRGYIGVIRYVLGFHFDNGKENGNYYNGVI